VSEETLSAEQTRWFAEEVQPHESDLRAYLHRRFPGLRDVDDVIQDTYSRIVRVHQLGEILDVRPYLFAAARNAAIDFFRHQQIVAIDCIAEIDRLPVVDGGLDAGAAADHEQELDLLVEAVHALPLRCREIIILRKINELSYHEIAQKMGISENTVKVQIALGVLRCRKYFLAHGITHATLKSANPTADWPR
jgi:RNA polymerase sigma-70 factor (ECF subfamily)